MHFIHSTITYLFIYSFTTTKLYSVQVCCRICCVVCFLFFDIRNKNQVLIPLVILLDDAARNFSQDLLAMIHAENGGWPLHGPTKLDFV